MAKVKFGTDGWRAVIAEDFTFANVDRVSQATADYWKTNPVPGTEIKAIVGYDRRFLSDQFGRRVAEVFAGNGYQVILTSEPTPTPAVSFAVKEQKAIGGVMITASHNPPSFNGYKLKAYYGGPAEPALQPGGRIASRSPTPFKRAGLGCRRQGGQGGDQGHPARPFSSHQETGRISNSLPSPSCGSPTKRCSGLGRDVSTNCSRGQPAR